MKIFLDTAHIEDIREIASWGIVDGATTNPTLLSRERGDPKEILKEICEIVGGPVSAEVIAQDTEGMIKEAKELSRIHELIVIKIPLTVEGLKATKVLAEEGIRVNTTLVFSPSQALLAAKAGATYVSPFIGRLDDISSDGMKLVPDILTIFDNYGFETELLVASIRHPQHVVEAALLGADIATVPPQILRKLVNHPLTDIGIERFLSDWEKVQGKRRL